MNPNHYPSCAITSNFRIIGNSGPGVLAEDLIFSAVVNVISTVSLNTSTIDRVYVLLHNNYYYRIIDGS